MRFTFALSRGEDPAEHLEEICNYLKWMKQAAEIQALFPHPKWKFLLFRIELHLDKLFKHLFAADCLLCDYGSSPSHHLKTYIEALAGERTISANEAGLLTWINVGISHHYMHLLEAQHAEPLKAMLDDSMAALAMPDGFELAGKKKGSSVLKDALQQALQLFSRYVPETLARLQREEERRRGEALAVQVK